MQTENNAQTSVRDEQASGAGTNAGYSTGSSAAGNAEEPILNSQDQNEPLNETGMNLGSDDETAMMDEDESDVEEEDETATTEDEETGTDEELSSEDFEGDDLEEAEEVNEEEDEEESDDENQTGTHAPTMKGV